MTNKIGTVRSAVHCPNKMIFNDKGYVCDLPDSLKDAPDGLIVYIDRDGRVQAMEEP